MGVVKVVEIIGNSPDSFEKAVECAVVEASKTIRNMVGVEVIGWTCKVDHGKIAEYRATCKIAFKVEGDRV